MINVAIIDEENEEDLENNINKFAKKNGMKLRFTYMGD